MNPEVIKSAKESLSKSFDVEHVDYGYESVEAWFPRWANDPLRIELPPRQKEIDFNPVIKTIITQKEKQIMTDNEMTNKEIYELIDELNGECNDPVDRPQTQSFWKNVRRSFRRKKSGQEQMVKHFQRLAGIVNNKVVAVLTLPTGTRVEFQELPSWKDVIKYKICGFKYETFD